MLKILMGGVWNSEGPLVFALASRGTTREGPIPRAVFGVSLYKRKRNRLDMGARLVPDWRVRCVNTKSDSRLSVTHLTYAKYTATTD